VFSVTLITYAVHTITQKSMTSKCLYLALGYPISNMILGSKGKVKGQGHRVTKCKKAIEWPTWVLHSIQCTVSSCLLLCKDNRTNFQAT